MKFRILSAILRSPWAIDEQFAIAHGGIIAGLINGFDIDAKSEDAEEIENSLPFAINASADGGNKKYSVYDEAPAGSIAVIPVRGPLMKEDEENCGYFTAGMDTLGNRVQEADLHPNIDGIVLYIDSPGGTVDGTQAFADKVKASSKPIVTFVDGMMCSAALWIGSSADQVIAQNSTTQIGSIGVMLSFADVQPMWEKEGVKFHRINADQSANKNKDFTDALKGDYKAIKEGTLNPLADQFINAVKENRPQITNKEVFTGKVYFAEDALNLCLIDEIGSLDVAVNRVSELSRDRKKKDKDHPTSEESVQNSNLKKSYSMKQLPMLISLLAVSSLESTEEGIFLNEEQLEAIEARLANDADALAAANQASETVDTLNSRIKELESELAEARQLPGAETATTVVENDAIEDVEDINAVLETLPMSERMKKLSK